MAALSADRSTAMRAGEQYEFPVAAAVKIYAGALVVLDTAGNAKPAVAATGLICVGRAEALADNSTGLAAAITVKVRAGVFKWDKSGTITKANIGDTLYLFDDHTVIASSAGSSAAGIMVDIDADGTPWVLSSPPVTPGSTGLLAANNLSDVASASTSRANLGANLVVLKLRATDLVGADAVLYGVVSPVAGTITKMWSVLKGAALATGDATLTSKINGTAVTNGSLTITQAASAIGDIDSATPTALNVLTAGQELQVLVGGTNTATAAFAEVSFRVET